MQHDQIAQPRQIPAVAEIPPKHEHLPGGVDPRHVQRLLPQRDAEHAIFPVLDKVVEPLPVHAVAPDRGTGRPQGRFANGRRCSSPFSPRVSTVSNA